MVEGPVPRWYHSVWFVLLSLFLVLGPLGLPLLWRSTRFSRWSKVALTLVMVLYTCGLILYIRAAFLESMRHFDELQGVFP